MKPVRIQLSRRNGFNLQKVSKRQNGLPAVNCARPGRYGNPFRVGTAFGILIEPYLAVALFRTYLELSPAVRRQFADELRGKNLACWCSPGMPCHVDVLLELNE